MEGAALPGGSLLWRWSENFPGTVCHKQDRWSLSSLSDAGFDAQSMFLEGAEHF